MIIVRDFAYQPTDQRFQGIYRVTTPPAAEEFQGSDESEDEDLDCDWSWPSEYKPIVDTTLQLLLNMKKDTWSAKRARAIFPFQKAAEPEMTLKLGDQIILLSPFVSSAPSTENSTTHLAENSELSRWSSIDEYADDEADTKDSSQAPKDLQVEPPELWDVVDSFSEFQKKYGKSWHLALKVKIHGKGDVVHVKLRDLGLVPNNYVEPSL